MPTRLAGCAVVLCLCAVCLVAGPLICAKCGYENPADSAVCAHCNAAFPAATPVARPVQDEKPVHPGKISSAVVEQETKAGLEQMRARDVAVARLFFRNAWALDLLASAHTKSPHTDRLTSLMKACDFTGAKGQAACPVCNGTGKIITRMIGLSGLKEEQTSSRPCPRCQGTSTLPRAETTSEKIQARGQARGRYLKIQQARRCVQVGNAWIPSNVEGSLGFRDTAVLKRTTADGCHACAGGGTTDCPTCKRIGEVKCPNQKCKGGREESVVDKLVGAAKVIRTDPCKICNSKGSVPCPACTGAGGVVCATCGGTGERPTCAKCSGRGYTQCVKCGGKGGECTACGGAGGSLCPTCDGDGRRK